MDYPYITLSEAKKRNYEVNNALIAEIDLNLIGHFGNIVTLEIRLSDGRVVFNSCNATARIGVLLQCLCDLLELSDEEGRRLSSVRNIPCRILCSPGGVIGAESGSIRRPCKIEWVRSIVRQCRTAGVKVFVKQLDIDGRLEKDIAKFPEDLQIRQIPWCEK
ncbi:MAG: DUF5131 family protein [Victivallaceae bacterium]|nr:DUF5131 family protein [Victivallaceae bacterium]